MIKEPLASVSSPLVQSFVMTPLTPLHIEAHAQFEPTHYLIDEGWLYAFDPLRYQDILSPVEREELKRFLDQTRATPEQRIALQRFFYDRRAHFKASAQLVLPVARSIESVYLHRLGVRVPKPRPGQERSFAPPRLVIERHALDLSTAEPLIPGSIFKSPLRSAFFQAFQSKKRRDSRAHSSESNERFSDPLYHMHIQHVTGNHVGRKVLSCLTGLHKQDSAQVSASPPVHTLRKEMILGGQYRALHGEWMFSPGQEQDEVLSFADIAKVVNGYFRPKLNVELHQLEQQGYSSNPWFQQFKLLCTDVLRPALESGSAMLLRMGQHNAKGQLLPDAVWFGLQDERDAVFPLGWMIVEPAGAEEWSELKTWCKQQSKYDAASVWKTVQQLQQEMEGKLHTVQQLQREVERKHIEHVAAEEAKKAALAHLSDERRKIAELAQALESSPVQSNTGTAVFQQVWTLLQEAAEWCEADQQYCALILTPLIKNKFPHLGKREKEVKACLRALASVDISSSSSSFKHDGKIQSAVEANGCVC